MSSTSEWLHFHQSNPNYTSSLGHVSSSYAATSPPDLFFSGLVSEATVVSTPTTPLAPDPAQLGPAGRVSKPVRRRTRASRRTPTTLINTDTSNFRAMVQQYTGGPGSCFPSLSGLGPQGFNVGPGLGYGLQYATPATSDNNSNIINASMFMQRNTNMVDNNNNNNNYNAYVTNTGSNNNYVKGGSSISSSENRSSNNFQF